MRRVSLAPLALVALLLVGCAGLGGAQYPIGQAINDLGRQFLATGELYDQAFTEGLITSEEYHAWAVFSAEFQTAYKQAYTAWLVGGEGTEDQIRALRTQLEIMALRLLKDR